MFIVAEQRRTGFAAGHRTLGLHEKRRCTFEKILFKAKLRIAAFFSLALGFLAYPVSVYLFPYVLIGESIRLSDGTRAITSPEAGTWIIKVGAITSLFLFVLTCVFLWLAARSKRQLA